MDIAIVVNCIYYISFVNYHGPCLSVQNNKIRTLQYLGLVRISYCVLLPTRNPEHHRWSGHPVRIISFGRRRDSYPYHVCRFNCSGGRTNLICVGVQVRTFCTRHPSVLSAILIIIIFFFFLLLSGHEEEVAVEKEQTLQYYNYRPVSFSPSLQLASSHLEWEK